MFVSAYQLLHSRVGSWSYLQTLPFAVKACQDKNNLVNIFRTVLSNEKSIIVLATWTLKLFTAVIISMCWYPEVFSLQVKDDRDKHASLLAALKMIRKITKGLHQVEHLQRAGSSPYCKY